MPPETAPRQRLEVNQRPINDLRHLIELIGQRRVERELNVHRTTVRRWALGAVAIPGAHHLAIRTLLGDHPGTAGKWTGWRFHDGLLMSPAGDRYTAGEVMAIGLNRQRLQALEQELHALRARVKVLEHLTNEAANEPRALAG